MAVLACRRQGTTILPLSTGVNSVVSSRTWAPAPSARLPHTRRARRAVPAQAMPSSGAAATDQLVSWLESNGCLEDSRAVRLAVLDGEPCIQAAREIKAGETILAVPQKAWISTDTVAASAIGRYVEGLEPWVQLVLFLLAQAAGAGAAQDCTPYATSLPEQTCNSTIFWTEEELAMLEGSQCLANTLGYRDFLEGRYAELCETVLEANRDMFPQDAFSYDRFLWAFGWVRARAHPPLEKDDIALVPIADLARHNSSTKSVWKVKDSGLFGRGQQVVALQSTRPYAVGDPIEMNFAPDGIASQLALDYGVGDRTLAGFSLTLGVPEDDRFFDDKADVAEINGYADSWTWTLRPDQAVPEDLLAYLRLVNCQAEDAFHLEALFRDVAWQHFMDPISEANERAVCQSIVDGCTEALNAYTSTIDEDLAMLRDGELTLRQRIAVEVRLGEKQTLDNYLNFFASRADKLADMEYYAESRLKSLGLLDDNNNNTFEGYLDSGIA